MLRIVMKQKPYILLVLALQSMLLGGCTFMKYMKNYNKSINEKIEKGEVESFQDALHFGTDYAQQIVTQAAKQKFEEALAKAQKNFEGESYDRAMLSVNDAIDIANRNDDAQALSDAFMLKAQIGKKYSFKQENGQFLYATEGVKKISLYHKLALSAAEACNNVLAMANILRDSADTHLMKTTLPIPEEFWQEGNFTTAWNQMAKQHYAGYHAALNLFQKTDTSQYRKLLDSIAYNNIGDIHSLQRLQNSTQSPEKKLFAQWKISQIYTEYIIHNNDFQYDMKYNDSLLFFIQKIHKTAYPLAEKLQDRDKQLQLMWRYVKSLQWQGKYDQALAENQRYAQLCGDSLYWANQLYAELYSAKYRLDSQQMWLDSANLYFQKSLSQMETKNLRYINDTVQQITLLDSMLQYWNCEQTLLYGKKLLALKEKTYGIAYCYHVLMRLGDCEREAGNWDVAKRYYAKAANIYIFVNGDFVNYGIWAKTLGSYSLPQNRFFLPLQLKWGYENDFLHKNLKIYHSPDSLLGYFSKHGVGYLIHPNNTMIANKGIWLKEASRKWDYLELREVQGKDTLRWLRVAKDILEIYSFNSNGVCNHKDSVLKYFNITEKLLKYYQDYNNWQDLDRIISNNWCLESDSIMIDYRNDLIAYQNNCSECRSALENTINDRKGVNFIAQSNPDSAYYYLKKAKNVFSNSYRFLEIADMFLLKNQDSMAIQSTFELQEEDYDRLASSYKNLIKYSVFLKQDKSDSITFYRDKLLALKQNELLVLGTWHNLTNVENIEKKYPYIHELVLFHLYQKSNNHTIASNIINFFEQRYQNALSAHDTLAAFNIAYHATIIASENQWWDSAAKYVDIARSFVENGDSVEIALWGNRMWKRDSITGKMTLDTIIYTKTHTEYIAQNKDLYNYAGLIYSNLAEKILYRNDDYFINYFSKAIYLAEQMKDSLKVVHLYLKMVETIHDYWDVAGINHNEKLCEAFMKNYDDDVLQMRYARAMYLESYEVENQEKWYKKYLYYRKKISMAGIPVLREYQNGYKSAPNLHYEAINEWNHSNFDKTVAVPWKDAKQPSFHYGLAEFYNNRGSGGFGTRAGDSVQHDIFKTSSSDIGGIDDSGVSFTDELLDYWTEIINYSDERILKNRMDEHSNHTLEGLIEAKRKNDSLQKSAILEKEKEANNERKAKEHQEELTQKADSSAKVARLSELKTIKAKQESDSLKIAAEIERDKAKIAEYNSKNGEDKAIESEKKALQSEQDAIKQKNFATRNMQGAFAAASLFLIAFFAAFAFYRKSQKEKRQVEFQKAEIENKNLLIYKQESELRHRIKNSLARLYSRIKEQLKYTQMTGDARQEVTLIRERVNAMSLLYQAFHENRKGGTEEVDLANYLEKLLKHIGDTEDTRIKTVFESVLFDVERSEFVGLFVNEAITNIFKHAFTHFSHSQHREIQVLLKYHNEKEIQLSISHNGKDISDVKLLEVRGKGIDFLKGLERQLRGKFWFEGTQTFLQFPIQVKLNTIL